MIAKGLAETHVHLNGAVHFEEQYWYLVCKRNVFTEKCKFLTTVNQLNRMVKKDIDLELNLLMSSFIRFYLGKFMYESTFKQMDDFIVQEQIAELIYQFLNQGLQHLSDRNEVRSKLVGALEKVERHIYLELFNCEDVDQKVYLEDYLSVYYKHLHLKGKENEYQFLYDSFQYLSKHPEDNLFFALFRRYVIVKNVLANYKIQGGVVRGLSYFHYFFSGQNGIIPLRDRYQIVFSHYTHLGYIQRLELRKSFTPSRNLNMVQTQRRIAKDILLFLEEYRIWLGTQLNDQTTMVALVYHFTKREAINDPCLERYIDTLDERVLPNGELQKRYEQCILALKMLLYKIPSLKNFVVGLDAASDENKSEPSVLCPVFLLMRNKYRYFRPSFYSTNDKQGMEGIGFTYHVGEVFNVLLSGYRHIDEVVSAFRLLPGDRLGHATALMIDIDEYLKRRQSSKIEVGEHLKNLLYLYHLKKDLGLLPNYDSIRLVNEIQSLAYLIFEEKNIDVNELYLWYESSFEFEDVIAKNLGKCTLRCRLRGDKPNNKVNWDHNRLNMASLCQYYCERMKRVISVDESLSKSQLYHDIQKYLVEKIQTSGIIIESNPISNSRIGEISDEFESPIRNINTYHLDENHQRRVMTSISTDDPAVFNTNLIYQYYLLEQQLILQGYATEEVLQWLNEIRENGIRSSFIRNEYRRKDILKILTDTIKELKTFLRMDDN